MAMIEAWDVGAVHNTFGREGMRIFRGSERSARRLAREIARKGGYGWRPCVEPLELNAEGMVQP